MDGISVIMPTFNQASFIRRAIYSLYNQSYTQWELIIVNDGSTDNTEEYISDIITSSLPIKYIRNKKNQGIGVAINQALNVAKYNYISYLPSDDYYDENHLITIKELFDTSDHIVLVYSGVRYDGANSEEYSLYEVATGVRKGYFLSLVQVAHKKTDDRWTERRECVSEDLFFTFWRKLTDKGIFVPTNKVTCEWTNHPDQRHKKTGEKFKGGLNKYRTYYNVQEPITIRTTNYKTINENIEYALYRKKNKIRKDALKIVLVGDLAYNAERVYAFEEAGHKLYGLWSKPAFCYSTIGRLPFGNVEDIPYESWQKYIKQINPDIFYAQISTGAILIANEVMKANTGIPLVWHFKESPHDAMKRGLWDKLIDLYSFADGIIYLNKEIELFYKQFCIPRTKRQEYLLDPELPKKNCFTSIFSEKLSTKDRAIHTVVIGRMIGLSIIDMQILAKNNIHIHLYNQNYTSETRYIIPFKTVAPRHFHVHSYCSQFDWVKEFSKYDAGWIHCFDSSNGNSINQAKWCDLNIPARINTLVAAGLPIIQKNNRDHIVAMKSYIQNYDIGIFYTKTEELVTKLNNKKEMNRLIQNVLANRQYFTFDHHVPSLIRFFRKVIANSKLIKDI
jgi:glycosyltransferase involved in cell wall biosynthesis